MLRKKKYGFSELDKPNKPLRLGLLAGESEIAETLKIQTIEEFQKLNLLCNHYHINFYATDNVWFELSLALAKEYIPGFQEKKPPGLPSKWTDLNGSCLVVEVNRLIKSGTAKNITHASKILSNREPWKSFLSQKDSKLTDPDPKEAIRKQYNIFKNNKLVKIAQDAFNFHEQQNSIPSWDQFVIDVVKKPHPK